jgi:glutamate--cysteine ligase
MVDARRSFSDAAVPNLTTAQTAPLLGFEKTLLERAADIESWFRSQWQRTAPPFYSSVDLRNAGFKLAPVDTNLFPGGFNNLNPVFDALCVQALQGALERVMPSAREVLLVPENHTRNRFYLENVAALQALIAKAGYTVRLGSLRDDLHAPETLQLESGRSLRLEPLLRDGDRVRLADGDFEPCVVLLNNDLSAGRPPILEGLSQPVVPPLGVGWSTRLKSQHFGYYREVAAEFAKLINIDPWWIDPLFRNCGEINFKTREGEECLAANVELLLGELRAKYDEYEVDEEPFVIVKADAGTYGMGVMTVRSVDDIRNLNRDARKKMASGKEGNEVRGAIIQEGVYTFEEWRDADGSGGTAEPVVYMIDKHVVGGFYRVHGGRSNQENLNAPGASFRQIAFANPCNTPDCNQDADATPNRFYAYGVVARLAMLAAARETAAATAREPQRAAASVAA